MDDKPGGVIGAEEKDLGNLQMKRLGSREPRIEKDRDRAKKDKDLLNAFFQNFTYSQHQVKQQANLTSSKRLSKLENFKNSYFSYN